MTESATLTSRTYQITIVKETGISGRFVTYIVDERGAILFSGRSLTVKVSVSPSDLP